MSKGNRFSESAQASPRARLFSDYCFQFCQPLPKQLDEALDRRLVETFFGLVLAMIQQRGGKPLLSELGSVLDAHAPAGTKRISRLLHTVRWTADLLDQFFWQQAEVRLNQLESEHEPAFAIGIKASWKRARVCNWRACVPCILLKPHDSNASNPVTLIRPVVRRFSCRAFTGWRCCCSGIKVRRPSPT
ncbi:MAG TPA: hypothetical protein VFD70_18525 [Anaerolineae bacterium]|nr:hypothetical protein [Anaerolineae bacterium]